MFKLLACLIECCKCLVIRDYKVIYPTGPGDGGAKNIPKP